MIVNGVAVIGKHGRGQAVPSDTTNQKTNKTGLVRGSSLINYRLYNLSILAAMMKSLSVRPSTLWVQMVIPTLPQVSRMSG